jgi:hypothetical protein
MRLPAQMSKTRRGRMVLFGLLISGAVAASVAAQSLADGEWLILEVEVPVSAAP